MRFFIGVCNNEHCYLHSFLFYFFAHLEALQYTHGSEIHCMYVTSIINESPRYTGVVRSYYILCPIMF